MKHILAVTIAAFLINAVATITVAQAQGKLIMPVMSADGRLIDQVELYSNSYALVIGIDAYSDGWPRLSNAIRDARAVAGALRGKGFEVTILENPGKAEISRTLEQFFIVKGDDPNARLFLWFAGHGHTENGEGYLIPADGKAPEAGAGFRLSALSIREVSNFTRLAQSKHVLAVFDACFAGTVFASSRARPPASITNVVDRPVRQFLTSGDAFQQVSDDGTFRELFLRALNGEERADANGDGYLTGSELGLFLTDRITNLTQGKQTPRYGKLRDKNFDLGDFIFATPKQAVLRSTQAIQPRNQTITADKSALDLAFWNAIKDSKDASAFQAYINKFPNGTFQSIARMKINSLSGRQVASIAPAQPAQPRAVQPRVVPPTPVQPKIAALPPQGGLTGSGLDGRWRVVVTADAGICGGDTLRFVGKTTISGGKFSTSIRRSGRWLYLKGDFNDRKPLIGGEAELKTNAGFHDFEVVANVAADTISKKFRSSSAGGCAARMNVTLTRTSIN